MPLGFFTFDDNTGPYSSYSRCQRKTCVVRKNFHRRELVPPIWKMLLWACFRKHLCLSHPPFYPYGRLLPWNYIFAWDKSKKTTFQGVNKVAYLQRCTPLHSTRQQIVNRFMLLQRLIYWLNESANEISKSINRERTEDILHMNFESPSLLLFLLQHFLSPPKIWISVIDLVIFDENVDI